MKLFSTENNPTFIEVSLIWGRYAPTNAYVHAYGCRLSWRRNKKNICTGRRDVYCGAYHLNADQIRNLATTTGLPEVACADVFHVVENNEVAHASLRIHLKDIVNLEAIEGVKTTIADRLWNGCEGPLKHMCNADSDLNPHPNNNLETAPRGLYRDNRSSWLRFWHVIRFQALSCYWQLRADPRSWLSWLNWLNRM